MPTIDICHCNQDPGEMTEQQAVKVNRLHSNCAVDICPKLRRARTTLAAIDAERSLIG